MVEVGVAAEEAQVGLADLVAEVLVGVVQVEAGKKNFAKVLNFGKVVHLFFLGLNFISIHWQYNLQSLFLLLSLICLTLL